MHKKHAVEMVESIIKDVNLDPCAEQTIKGTSGLFNLSRVHLFFFFFFFWVHKLAVVLFLGTGVRTKVL